MSVILLDQQIVHYEVLGRGRPVIFLHSWLGSWRYWIPSMQSASINYRSYALDFWGFGDTARDKKQYALNKQVELLNGFIDQMGMGQVALVGHGLGAVVALKFAAQYPGVANRILSINCPFSPSHLNTRMLLDNPQDNFERILQRTPLTEAVFADLSKIDAGAAESSLLGLEDFLAAELIKQSNSMVLCVNGREDTLVSVPEEDRLQNLGYKSHGMIFDQCGHFLMLEEDAKFNRLVIEFLSLGATDTPRSITIKEEWKRRVR